MRPMRLLRRGAVLLGVGAVGGAAVVTARHLLNTPQQLESGLGGEGRVDREHGGSIYYNVAGPDDAQPLVLLHDFYPGASNFEYRHVFARLAPRFRVYAPDWLGFGMSEHPHLAYTGEFYGAMLNGFISDVIGKPAAVMARGRAANIAVRAAADAPDLYESLVLISPYTAAGIELQPTLGQIVAQTAQRASLGLVPYALLSSRPLLRRMYVDAVSSGGTLEERDEAVAHMYASAHQFGGEHALLALLTGELDLPLQNVLALLEPPALIVCGSDDASHPAAEMEDLAVISPHADLVTIEDAGALIMEDQPAAFCEAVAQWIESEHQLLGQRDRTSRSPRISEVSIAGVMTEIPPDAFAESIAERSESDAANEDIVMEVTIATEPAAPAVTPEDLALQEAPTLPPSFAPEPDAPTAATYAAETEHARESTPTPFTEPITEPITEVAGAPEETSETDVTGAPAAPPTGKEANTPAASEVASTEVIASAAPQPPNAEEPVAAPIPEPPSAAEPVATAAPKPAHAEAPVANAAPEPPLAATPLVTPPSAGEVTRSTAPLPMAGPPEGVVPEPMPLAAPPEGQRAVDMPMAEPAAQPPTMPQTGGQAGGESPATTASPPTRTSPAEPTDAPRRAPQTRPRRRSSNHESATSSSEAETKPRRAVSRNTQPRGTAGGEHGSRSSGRNRKREARGHEGHHSGGGHEGRSRHDH